MRASNHRTFPIMPIALESPDQPDVIALIAELDAYQDTLYPPESRHIFDLAGLKQPNVLFAVARDAVGCAMGCAAIVLYPEFGELKRMYVSPAGRGEALPGSSCPCWKRAPSAVAASCSDWKPAPISKRRWRCTPRRASSVAARLATMWMIP